MASSGQDPQLGGSIDLRVLRSHPPDVMIDILIQGVRPVDGTLDAEAERLALHRTLFGLLGHSHVAGLLDLSREHCLLAAETFLATSIFLRLELDIGKNIQNKARSYTDASNRFSRIEEYIKTAVSQSMIKHLKPGETLDQRKVSRIIDRTLHDTFVALQRV